MKDEPHRKPSKHELDKVQSNVTDAKRQKTDLTVSSMITKSKSVQAKQTRISSEVDKKQDESKKASTTPLSPTRKPRFVKPPPPPPPRSELKISEHQKKPPPPPRRPPERPVADIKKKPPPPRTSKNPISEQRKMPPPPPRSQGQQLSVSKPQPKQHAPPRQQQKQPPPPPLEAQSPNIKPKVDLPPGWMCVWSKSQNRWYFFDTTTNKSVWQWPPPGGLPH